MASLPSIETTQPYPSSMSDRLKALSFRPLDVQKTIGRRRLWSKIFLWEHLFWSFHPLYRYTVLWTVTWGTKPSKLKLFLSSAASWPTFHFSSSSRLPWSSSSTAILTFQQRLLDLHTLGVSTSLFLVALTWDSVDKRMYNSQIVYLLFSYHPSFRPL